MREQVPSVCLATFVPVHYKSRGYSDIFTFISFNNEILQFFIFVCICFCKICSDDDMNLGGKSGCQINNCFFIFFHCRQVD